MAVRIGFIGAGRITKGHMERLSQMPDVKLTAYADLNEAAAQAAADQFGGSAFSDAKRMLDETELDGVYVCLPPFAHGPAERLAIQHNLPIYVEKPVHMDIGEARELAAEIEGRALVSAAGYQERYMDIIDRLRGFLAGRSVGLFMGYWLGATPRGGSWWVQKSKSGGQAVEQTTHVFDMARYLFGEVRQVQAVGRIGVNQGIEGYDIEDASAVNLAFANGVIGTVFSGCFLNVREGIPAGLDIFCSDAVIKYQRRRQISVATSDTQETWVNENAYWFDADRAFVEAIARKDPSRVRCTYADGVRSAEVSLAVNLALETGQSVDLPLITGAPKRRAG